MPDQRRTPRSRPAGRPDAARRTRTPAGSSSATSQQPAGTGGRSRLTGRAAVLFLVLLVLLISYASSLRAWLQQRDDTAQARAEVARAKQNIAELKQRKQRLDDPAYIKRLARESFGWVMPGETAYTVLDENGDVLGSTGGLSEPASGDEPTERDWYAKVWGSVRAAGEEPRDDAARDTPGNKPDNKRVVRPEGARR